MSDSLSKKELAVRCITAMNKEAKFENHLGVEIVEIDEGFAKLSMKIQDLTKDMKMIL